MTALAAAVRKPCPLGKVYALLEPGPVLLMTTASGGQHNVMTLSWHTMLEFEPPRVGCVVSNRNHSFGLLTDAGECVLNIPTVELATAVVRCGNSSGARTDKFKRHGLTPVAGRVVAAPLIDECFACLECRVVDTRMVPDHGLFVLEVVQAWVDRSVRDPRTLHHRGHGRFMVAGETIRLPSRKK